MTFASRDSIPESVREKESVGNREGRKTKRKRRRRRSVGGVERGKQSVRGRQRGRERKKTCLEGREAVRRETKVK